MRPFTALYFIKANRWRASLIVAMFVLTFAVYLGGLYISNIGSMFDYAIDRMDRVAIIEPIQTDYDGAEFQRAVDMLDKNDKITFLKQGKSGLIYTKSIMGFATGVLPYAFRNAEDFLLYCDFVGISLSETNAEGELGNGSVIMSGLQANNRGMQLGDFLTVDNPGEYFDGDFRLDALTDEEDYSAYYINDTETPAYMILPTGMNDDEYRGLLEVLKTDYKIRVMDYDYYREMMDRQLSVFEYLYFLLIILMAVVMAITTNAALTGMYQHRQGEFALYQAIGISKWKIRKKIVGEVFLMDVAGIVTGACIVMLGVYLMNSLYLLERGLKLFYYNKMALQGLAVSNVIIFMPVTVLQGRRLMKTDICDY